MVERAIRLHDATIQEVLDEKRAEGKTIGLCHGCFDLVHFGHLLHFEEAKKLCDFLVVSVTTDRFVNKGPGRPLFNEEQRLHQLALVREVDAVCISNAPTAQEILDKVRPDFYFKGTDYADLDADPTGMIKVERDYVESLGGKLVITATEKHSSTDLMKASGLTNLSDASSAFLDQVRAETSLDEILHYLDNVFPKLSIAVLGDIIIDEYVGTLPVGTTTKSPTISCIFQDTEVMAGGTAAIARHVAEFAGNVNLVCQKGGRNWAFDDLLAEIFPDNLSVHWVESPDRYTPQKVRYFSFGYPNTLKNQSRGGERGGQLQKLFELAYLNSDDSEAAIVKKMLVDGEIDLSRADAVIWADFGHGLLNRDVWQAVTETTSKVVANVQTNSTNFGFNLAGKYPGADVICIDELEARLILSDRDSSIDDIWDELRKRVVCSQLIVTRGMQGIRVDYGKSISEVPALAVKVVDPVGAGDAVLSAAALCRAAKAPATVTNVLLSAFGAIACMNVGNSEPVRRDVLLRFLSGCF